MATDEEIGIDLSCTDDLDPGCALVTGRRLICEAIYRRLITPRGRLLYDPDYGYDITQFINDDITPSQIEELQAGIEAECRKDQRVTDVDVVIEGPPAGIGTDGAYTIKITLFDGNGPFDLTLVINDVTVEILKIAA